MCIIIIILFIYFFYCKSSKGETSECLSWNEGCIGDISGDCILNRQRHLVDHATQCQACHVISLEAGHQSHENHPVTLDNLQHWK
jgi:hypothetical protein